MANTQRQPKGPSIDDWMKKMCYIHTVEYYLAVRKDEILPFLTTWMDPENVTKPQEMSRTM